MISSTSSRETSRLSGKQILLFRALRPDMIHSMSRKFKPHKTHINKVQYIRNTLSDAGRSPSLVKRIAAPDTKTNREAQWFFCHAAIAISNHLVGVVFSLDLNET